MDPLPQLISLTELPRRTAFFIDPACIRIIARDPQNPIQTLICTYQGTNHAIAESPEETARLVNAGRQGLTLKMQEKQSLPEPNAHLISSL